MNIMLTGYQLALPPSLMTYTTKDFKLMDSQVAKAREQSFFLQ